LLLFDVYFKTPGSGGEIVPLIYPGREEGLATGRAEGLAEGLAEGKKETARNLKEMGMDPEIISKATGLSLAELEAME
jgi:predicted transposase/invertase (TIGR01784 family)